MEKVTLRKMLAVIMLVVATSNTSAEVVEIYEVSYSEAMGSPTEIAKTISNKRPSARYSQGKKDPSVSILHKGNVRVETKKNSNKKENLKNLLLLTAQYTKKTNSKNRRSIEKFLKHLAEKI